MKKVLIANRGEIALRAVHACHSLGLSSVAVYSSADAASPHVWAATEAVCVGPAPSSKSYLQREALLHVAKATGCDAVYPGYGFLAESAEFAERCTEEGLIFVGPDADTIRTMGDKAAARRTAISLDVPVVPGSRDAFSDVADAMKATADIGFPILIKASAGGGGRGMRIAEDEAAFKALFVQASREAEQAFGDAAVYLERLVANVRHIEVQVFGDGTGHAVLCAQDALADADPGVRIGAELPLRELEACAIVASSYDAPSESAGQIGVLGPSRMDYRATLGAVRAVADTLERAIAGMTGTGPSRTADRLRATNLSAPDEQR